MDPFNVFESAKRCDILARPDRRKRFPVRCIFLAIDVSKQAELIVPFPVRNPATPKSPVIRHTTIQ
jgi:hypothetical protein